MANLSSFGGSAVKAVHTGRNVFTWGASQLSVSVANPATTGKAFLSFTSFWGPLVPNLDFAPAIDPASFAFVPPLIGQVVGANLVFSLPTAFGSIPGFNLTVVWQVVEFN